MGVLALAALVPGPALAQQVAGEVRLGGGYDSNPSFATDSSNRRLPQRGRAAASPDPVENGVFQIEGWAGGELGDETLRAVARLDVEGRIYGSGVLWFWERLRIGGFARLDPVTPRCAVEGTRFDSSFRDDAAWTVSGTCGARVDLPLGLWFTADASAGARFFDVGQADVLAGGAGSVGWTLSPVTVELALAAWRRESDEPLSTRWEIAPSVLVRLSTEYVGGEVLYRAVSREFDQGPRSGVEHVGRMNVWVMPIPWLGGYADLEVGYADGEAQALAYERVQIVGGVRLALDWVPPARASEASADQGPVRVEEGRAHFRFELPGAATVAVIGDFNRWNEERGALRRTDDGAFEGSFEVSPGRHAYVLMVDGEPRRPPGARRYAPDGFGGENAVFIVPAP